MYGPNIVGSTLSLTKVLGGISRVLGIANQAIPIYKEIRPMISNARKVMSVLKEFNATPTKNTSNTITNIGTQKKEVETTSVINSATPTFFLTN